MKLAKRILTVALALVLVFVMAAPSFAIVSGNQPTNGGDSYYVQSNLSDYYVNGQITVHLHIATYKYTVNNVEHYVNRAYNVTVGTANATNQLITVLDVLNKLQQDNVGISFSIQHPYDDQYEYLLNGVHDTLNQADDWYYGAILYKNNTPYPCNYMFRINGMLPFFIPSGETEATGCLISNAYVTDGDNIDVYYANAYQQTRATGVEYVRQDSNKTFQILYSKCYYTNPLDPDDWNPTNWILPYGDEYGESVDIYIDGSLTTVSVDENGKFTRNSLTAGTHTFRTDSTLFLLFTDYYGTTNYYVPTCVSMYSVFSVT